MQNPFQSTTANNLNDPLAFVKKLWGDMQLPGMVTPTLSVDELDKQIKDLKTVESWLNVNMNMLKGTIQALEVQRATISALKTMGESFAQATAKPDSVSSVAEATANWPMHAAAKAGAGATTSVIREPSVEENEEETEDDEVEPSPPEDINAAAKSEKTATAEPLATDRSSMHNPAAWWTVLQDQFKQALHHAMKDETQQKPDASAPVTPKSAAKPNKKTAAKAAPANRQRVTKATAASTPKTKVAVTKPKSATKVVAKTTTAGKSRSRA